MSATEAPRAPIKSPAVWRSADLADRDEWTIELTDDQRHQLASVARSLRAAGRTIGDLTIDDVSLPSLAEPIATIIGALARGRGFILLCRFPVDLLDEDETEIAYAALGVHLGTPVSQDA
jgi:hypothetical protein